MAGSHQQYYLVAVTHWFHLCLMDCTTAIAGNLLQESGPKGILKWSEEFAVYL